MADDAPVMHPNKRNFVEGLDLIFDRWVALRMAVEMEWGGPDATSKAEEFKAGLIEYFDRGKGTGYEGHTAADLVHHQPYHYY